MLKVEPLATTQQNVTMFPVIVRIENRDGRLRPGMNAEVEIHVGQRDSVLAIPNAALRTQRDVGSAAQVLGLDPGRDRGPAGRQRQRRQGRGPTRRSARRRRRRWPPAPAAAPATAGAPAANTMTTPDGRTITLPPGVTEAQVRAIFAKRMSGKELTDAERATLRQVFAGMGGGRPGGGARPRSRTTSSSAGATSSSSCGTACRRPVNVRTGLTDLDYSEVMSGVALGDSVLILPSASLIQSQQEFKQRIGNMTGGGAPRRAPDHHDPRSGRRTVAMQFGETIAVAFQSIRANKLRTALTMLGVIIGVAAVIAMVALGTGAQRAVEERIAALGANLLTVFPGQSFRQGVASNVRVSLTTDDAEAIARDAPLIEAVVPEMQSSLQVKYGNKNINANIVGTTANYAEVRNYTVPYGRMFTSGDDEARQRYAVLGFDVPEMLGANPAALIGPDAPRSGAFPSRSSGS